MTTAHDSEKAIANPHEVRPREAGAEMLDPDNPSAQRPPRSVLLVFHSHRDAAVAFARQVAGRLDAAGILVFVPSDEVQDLGIDSARSAEILADGSVSCDAELVVVVGGDGTILRAAERSRGMDAPLLGVNLGHVGFLAEAEAEALPAVVDAVIHRRYTVEERLAIEASVTSPDAPVWRTWALNEISVEKCNRQKMLEIALSVDGEPLSEWGCDGIVFATPTGSTAYAFSAGGPVVWPEVSALLVVPISAHALFARPLVVSPESSVCVRLLDRTNEGVLFADGRRTVVVSPGASVTITKSVAPVRFARLHEAPFTGRLVAKFDLPVTGWRSR